MKTGWRSQWVLVLLGMSLAACGEAPTPNAPFEPASTAQAWKDKPVMHMALQEVVDTYVLGCTRTELQREAMSTTGLGGVGALMVIAGVLVATGTGVGIATAISTFVFGIPWVTVGALVLPGALLVVVAAKKARPVDDVSLSVALAYKLLERLEKP